MRRRDFIVLVGSTGAAWPVVARAQRSERMRRIGVLLGLPPSDPVGEAEVAALGQALDKLGWVHGRTAQITYRWAGVSAAGLRASAGELIDLSPEVIISRGTPATVALMQQTKAIPIVFTVVAEPITGGLVASLARPGGNITGFTNVEPSIGGKWLELLKEMAPRISRVALIFNPTTAPYAGPFVQFAKAAASSLSVEATATPVHREAEIENTVIRLAHTPDSGLVCITDSFMTSHRALIVELANKYRLPAIYPFPLFVSGGGLMSYGVDTVDMGQRAASYIDRILRGEAPANLPVQLPTKFNLMINLKAAKAIGLEVPLFLQQRADEVIE